MIYRPAVLNSSIGSSSSRRSLFRLAVTAAVFAGAIGCNKKSDPAPEAARLRRRAGRGRRPRRRHLTVGFIYVGPKDDYGYNQAHAEGAAARRQAAGREDPRGREVPETVAVQKTMESMINLDGAKVLFPTSFGYFDPHILKVAEKYPNVTFLHCGGLYTEGKHPKNVGSYFGYIDEAAVRLRHRRRPDQQEQQARLHRRQADPAGPAQHQRVHAGRALGEPEGHD